MSERHAIERLVGILDDLREKCPWDRKQTIQSLRQLTIEECHELADAITQEDWKGIREELGDILLHIVFYAKIGKEQGQFNLEDVIHTVCEKLIYRHPHIYGDVVAEDEETVKRNWENLKLKEGKTSILSGVPRSLPSLVQAMRLQEKASQVGFDWENRDQVWDKVKEEMGEVEEVVKKEAQGTRHEAREKEIQGTMDEAQEKEILGKRDEAQVIKERIEEELGDLMFSIINYARFNKIDPDNALAKTNRKFISRFQAMEKMVAANGQLMTDLNLQQMDELWNAVKLVEKSVG